MPKTAGSRNSYDSMDILFTYHSQPALNPYIHPFSQSSYLLSLPSHSGTKAIGINLSLSFYFVAKKKGEKNGDDGLGQGIEVSHLNHIAHVTGVVDEKDERACSPLSQLIAGHHEQVCRQV